jgi:urease accessory protein
MHRATAVVRKPAVKPDLVADTVTLDHKARQGHRAALRGAQGLEFVLDLEKAAVLNHGDAVKLEDGRLVRVNAAPQELLEVRAENPARLMRAAWHLGGSHAAVEITADAIYIERDAVLTELVRGLGCTAVPTTRPFQPEQEAHGHHHHGHHEHHHGHNHEH